jgi:hypothetical protein
MSYRIPHEIQPITSRRPFPLSAPTNKPPFTPAAQIFPFRFNLAAGQTRQVATNSISVQKVSIYNEGPGNLFYGTASGLSLNAPPAGGQQPGNMLPLGVGVFVEIQDMALLYIGSDTGCIADVNGISTPQGTPWGSPTQ